MSNSGACKINFELSNGISLRWAVIWVYSEIWGMELSDGVAGKPY